MKSNNSPIRLCLIVLIVLITALFVSASTKLNDVQILPDGYTDCGKGITSLAKPNFSGFIGDISCISDVLFYPNDGQIHVRIVRPILFDDSGFCITADDGLCCAEDESNLNGVFRLYTYDVQRKVSEFVIESSVSNSRFISFIGLSDSTLYYIAADGFKEGFGALGPSESIYVSPRNEHPNTAVRNTDKTIICRASIPYLSPAWFPGTTMP